MSHSPTIVWLRQDLRLADHPALDAAMRLGPVVPAYIWAPDEEAPWAPGGASRWWLHHSLASLAVQFEAAGSKLVLRRGPTLTALDALLRETGARRVVWCRRYEPAAVDRDAVVKAALLARGVACESFCGSLLHEPWTVNTKQGRPFQVFTPFWRACQALAADHRPTPAPQRIPAPDAWPASTPLDELDLLPKTPWDQEFARRWRVGAPAAEARLATFVSRSLRDYHEARDRIDGEGFSQLSPHLHFGELSPRQVWAAVAPALEKPNLRSGAERFLAELGWREFAHHLLHHFPHTTDDSLREEFRRFPWSTDRGRLRRWRRGQTGYPIVDAAMRELWATGFLPNRARMIVASFLSKDLLIPWQCGAAWFWDTLVDADLANNTLGWQWTAGCGADAAPYFRIFNPTSQAQRYDPDAAYIRRWIPELARLPAPWIFEPWTASPEELAAAGIELGVVYPRPMIDHAAARSAALAAFERIRCVRGTPPVK